MTATIRCVIAECRGAARWRDRETGDHYCTRHVRRSPGGIARCEDLEQ